MKHNKIVFAAHDFSPASKNALELAADLAFKTGSRLFIYHVVSTSVLTDSENLYTYNPKSFSLASSGHFLFEKNAFRNANCFRS